ncbi:MAG: hypothetical protein KDA88_24955 [Planctomycetaceae bacterium]|nr:hypothetical protein [Planctomycetaceae bacterium]
MTRRINFEPQPVSHVSQMQLFQQLVAANVRKSPILRTVRRARLPLN